MYNSWTWTFMQTHRKLTKSMIYFLFEDSLDSIWMFMMKDAVHWILLKINCFRIWESKYSLSDTFVCVCARVFACPFVE